jgi:hypothetical protein
MGLEYTESFTEALVRSGRKTRHDHGKYGQKQKR